MDSLSNKPVNIHITPSALNHFADLIAQEDEPDMGLRIFLDRPGLPTAEVGITFCPPGENKSGDVALSFEHFKLFVDKASAPFLEAAEIDFQKDALGGQLAVTAPNMKGKKPSEEAPLKEKIEYILNSEINPNLASHGDMVTLIDIQQDNRVVLQFGGGCHGCGMADVTLKQGIEKTLLEQLPEITAVVDATDHSKGTNPYY